MRMICTPLVLALALVQSAAAQQWARDMLKHTSHDFGTVARGAKVEHGFTMENIYVEDVHVASIRSSCSCTTPELSRRTLKTWDKVDIVAKVDTRGYYGRKDATLTVVLDKPFPAEVQLHVHVYIRSDVVVQPGSVQFGTVVSGTPLERKLTVSYAGRPDWQIVRVETGNPHLQAKVVPLATRNPTEVQYELTVKLKETAPEGHIKDQIVLVTNDRRAQASRVPVAVDGEVVPAVTVRPSPFSAIVEAGAALSKRLVVQGETPFRILKVSCDDERFQFTVPQEANAVHLISVSFTAGDTPEKIEAKIRIETDSAAGKLLELPLSISVTPKGPTTF